VRYCAATHVHVKKSERDNRRLLTVIIHETEKKLINTWLIFRQIHF
jgi:hypothetical protein